MSQGPDLLNAFDIHNVGAVYADKTRRVERSFDRVHGHVQQVGSRPGMEPDVVLRSFDSIHFRNRQEDRAFAVADDQTSQRAMGMGD